MTDVVDSYALSPLQQGMLFHAVSEKQTGVDIEQVVITLRDPCDVTPLIRAWQAVIQRYTILRTRFRWEDVPEPKQEVVAQVELPLTEVDWRDIPRPEREKRFLAQLAADRLTDFDLSRAPAMRLFVAQMASDEQRILWTFHHALLDGRSFPIVLREVFALYEAALRGVAVPLPPPEGFRQHIDWLQSLDLASAEAYWRNTLKGFRSPTPFGVDQARANGVNDALEDKSFGVRQTRLSTQLTTLLREAAQIAGVTVNTLLQGAWALLLHRYSSHTDIVFGATRAGRRSGHGDNKQSVGLFINTLPLRIRVDGDLEVTAWLRELRAQQTALRAFEHTPLSSVQSWSEVPNGTPLFESLVVYEHRTLDAQLRALGGEWEQRRFEYIGQTNFPLALIAYGDDELLLRLEYSRQRFSAASIDRMMGHLGVLLAGLASDTTVRLKQIELLTNSEREELVGRAGQARSYAVGATLHERFEQQVARTPEALALTACVDETPVELTYAQLNARANRLAQRLRELGVGPNQLVGLRVERNAQVAIGILAILKAGGAYLPLDPVYPTERIAFMLEDAGVRIVLTQRSLQADLAALPYTLLCLDQLESAESAVETANLPPLSAAPDLAYVIYTSGSTGKPKGVRITHANVGRLFLATDAWFGFHSRDVWTLFHSYAFDFSVWELWGALLYGGRVVVVPLEISRNTEAFRELLLREGITVLNQTPTAFRQLIDTDSALPPAEFKLRYVVFGGEALELQSLNPWLERYGDSTPRLINMYGITETTVHVTYRPISRADLAAGRGSVIGEPIPDLRLYLLDANSQPVPLGVPGEMYVAGAGVAPGYLNRPELTAQRFLRDPFATDPNARMYRSGDLARRLEHGELEYLGRIDQQVKIRGFRIELGEIEAVIAQHPGVRQVAVIDREDVPGERRLVAYLVVVQAQAQPQLVQDLRERLRQALPDYMTPAHFLFVPALILTPNGKLDRKALPAPQITRTDDSKPFNPPRTPVEQTIADVWKAVLRVDRVGIDDHFFELGGDSILSISVIARCRQRGVRLTPKDLFRFPTIAQLARVVGTESATRATSTSQLSGTVALTPIQQWFFAQHFEHVHHWNQAFMFEVPAGFDPAVLEAALAHVTRHHDALRLHYKQRDGIWIQQYTADAQPPCVQRVDLTGLADDEQPAAITEYAARAQTQFNLETGPLLCVVHFALGSEKPGRLLLAVHHLIVDGVSWRVLREDIESAYLALAAKATAQLLDRTTSMQTWAQRVNEHAQTTQIHESLPHWRATNQVRPAEVPADNPTGPGQVQPEKLVMSLTDPETRALLQQLPAAFRTQINDVLLSALAAALNRRIGSGAFRIDMEGHGREHIADDLDVSRTVGWFTTLFPVALEIPPGADTLSALLAIRDQLRKVPHRGLSYGLLRYASSDATVRDALAVRPATVLFNYLGQFDAVVTGSELFAFAPESTGPWRSPQARRTHALEIIGIVRNGHLELEWHYDSSIHGEATIASLANNMVATLRELLALADTSPDVPFTPADFPLADIDQTTLDRLVRRYPQIEEIYPLTPMQRLFFAMESSQSNVGFEQWHFQIEGALNSSLLQRAVQSVIVRHSILRTAFVAEAGAEPLQIVARTAELPWSEEDWRTLPATEQEARIATLLRSDANATFDLGQPPAMRVTLRRIADARWHFIWSTHHLCIDGWSWPLVLRDVSRAYTALESGAVQAPTAATAFREYVEWLGASAPRSEDFWKSQLEGFMAPTPFKLGLPASATAPQSTHGAFAEVVTTIDTDITNALQALARAEQVTPSVLFNAAWSLLLAHYSGSGSVVFGAAFSGRPAELRGIESMVGPCVNNLPVRTDIVRDETLSSWLRRIQQRQFELAQHQYASPEQIQQWASVPWRYRLFDSLVVFQNYQVDEDARRIGSGARTILLASPEATNYALTLTVTIRDEMCIRLIYQPGSLATADVRQFAADLTTVLQMMSRSATQTLDSILGSLPPSLSGKAAALVAASKSQQRAVAHSAPASEAERSIAVVWQELFGVERVSLDDNFFDLGGHSLLLIRAHARLKEVLRPDLPIVALLQFPTVRALARHLTQGPSQGATSQAAMDRAQKQREAQNRRRALAGKS